MNSVALIFWSSIGIVCFIYFLYPLVISLIAAIAGKKYKKEDITPTISLIIPVHNEEAVLKEKVENIRRLDYPKENLQVIFALDGCTDKSKDILNGYQGIEIIDNRKREGKVQTLNKAVGAARGKILLFTDANSLFQEDALRKLIPYFADSRVGCVCGRLKYENAQANTVSRGENLYWRYETFLKRTESRIGKLLITNGSFQAVRKELYPYPDPELADDFSIPILIQAKRYDVVYETAAVVTERATQTITEEWNQKVRIILQGLKGTVRLRKEILHLGPVGLFEFLTHKLLRWLIPVFLLGIFFSNLFLVDIIIYRYLFFLQLLFYACAIIGFLGRNVLPAKIFAVPFYFSLVNAAALLALIKFVQGKDSRIWDKAESTRVTQEEK